MSRLMLRFGERFLSGETEVEWLVQSEDRSTASHGRVAAEGLAETVAAHAPWADDPARVVVFVAAADVLLLCARVPGRSAAQIRQAAPYAVEEFLAEDIDAMHVACGAIARGAPVECLVAPRTAMAAWLEVLADAGVAAGFMTSDAMAVEVADDAVSVLYDGEAALVRARGHAAAVDRANLPGVLDALRASFDEASPPMLRQAGGEMTAIELSQAGFAPEQAEAVHGGPPLAYLAAVFDQGAAANLLQGEFAPRRQTSASWAAWRSVAASAGAVALLALAAQAGQGAWANRQADAMRAQAADLFRAIYDVQRVPGNPATRMRFRLGQIPEGASGFHRLLGNLGIVLQELPGRYDLMSLTYSERGGLGAQVLVSDYDALERLQAALVARGIALEVAAAEQFEQRVRARLRIGG